MSSERIIDPRTAALRVGMQKEGWQTQRDLQQADEDTRRFADAGLDRLIIQETFTTYAVNPPANDESSMEFVMAFGTTSFTLVNYVFRTPAQARVLLIRITSSADVTAGTVTPRIVATESGLSTGYTFTEVEMSTADPRFNTARFNWENAVQIARDAQFGIRLVTSAAYAPTTLDYVCQVVFGYEDWASS
jgi:hypothetical protein